MRFQVVKSTASPISPANFLVKNISGCVQIVTFSNVSLFQPLTRLRLNNSVELKGDNDSYDVV